MNLIVPMAGRSSRFPGVRPKWMLTHPNGKFMALEAISGFNQDLIDRIFFVYLKEHEEQYKFLKGFREELEDAGLIKKILMVELPEPTRDQPETVYQAIKRAGIKGPILIKDSDNRFTADIPAGNFIHYYNLNEAGLIKPKNKSYIATDSFGNVVNIIEKQVISPYFCVGGYGFESAELYTQSLQKINSGADRYISNVIYQALLDKQIFKAEPVRDYNDWGTLEDWERYKRSFATLFIDLDGIISEHSASHFPPYYGESGPLKENVDILIELHNTGKFQFIITTARPEKYRKITEKQLQQFGIHYTALLMDMFHSKRIIINDYSKSNPYKSCDAINLKRNSTELKEILREALGVDYEEI
ncbi:MAG: hypothetical protein JXJ22_15970 [Bacteroidales bacterium]|nr:hypothetical protein [Bacteroidales bacterium]